MTGCTCICRCVLTCTYIIPICTCVHDCFPDLSALYCTVLCCLSAVIVSGPNWISAQAINTSSILVDWDPLVINPPAVTDITGYMVEYKRTSDTIYQSHGPVEHSPALITGLSSNTLYTFRVVPIARSNMPSDIVGPFPSSLRAASTPATTGEPVSVESRHRTAQSVCVVSVSNMLKISHR